MGVKLEAKAIPRNGKNSAAYHNSARCSAKTKRSVGALTS